MKSELLGSFTYCWDESCFPLGADSLALGEFAAMKSGQKVLDLGCGAGLLLLLAARRESCETLFGVEQEPHAAALARENLTRNGLAGTILTADFVRAELPADFDLVLSNPPWYPEGSGAVGGAGRMETRALPELCAVAAKALKHKGRLALCYPAQRLTDVLLALRGAGLEPKRLRFCRHRPDKKASCLLVEGVKGGRPGVELLPELLYGEDKEKNGQI